MIKTCAVCVTNFKTKDSRQKTCSQACANISRSRSSSRGPMESPLPGSEDISEPIRAAGDCLPPPEELPAPYAKRVYDMWRRLIEDTDVRTRIA